MAGGRSGLSLLSVDLWSVKEAPEKRLAAAPRGIRWGVYLVLLIVIVVFGSYGTGYNAQSFVYFQF